MTYKEEYRGLIFEKKGHIAYVTFNNPEVLNALSPFMFDSINELLDDMAKDRDVWGVIMTGAGRSFIAGADLRTSTDTKSFGNYFTPEANRDMRLKIHKTFTHIAEFERPIICAINGYALGGGAELALCTDIRIASKSAKIGYPEVKIGGIAAYAGITRASRILSPAAAKEMLFTGKHYTAEEALRLGFVSYVVEPEELIPAAEALLGDIINKAPIAVKYTKMMIDKCVEMSYEGSLEFERALCSIVCESEDFVEGSKAFKEKRDPAFKNN